VCCQVKVSASSWSLVQRSPTVLLLCVWNRNLVNEEALAHWWGGGLLHQIKSDYLNFIITSNWHLLHINKRFVGFWNKFSKIPPSTSVHFAPPVWRSHFVRLSWSSSFFFNAGSSIQNAGEQFVWCTTLSFVNFAVHPTHKQKSNEQCAPSSNSFLYLSNHSELETRSYELHGYTVHQQYPTL